MKTVIKSNKRLHYALWIACLGWAIAMTSCDGHDTGQLKRVVDSFAVNYFNWQFHKTIPYVAPESEKWLAFAASQVHQADIDLLKEKERPATCEIRDIEIDDSDSLAVAHVTIRDFLRMDTIGRAATVIANADFDIPLRFMGEEQKWMVNIQAPLRPVKRGN